MKMLSDETYKGRCYLYIKKKICRRTLSWQQVSADKGSIHILQQNDALLWCHTQQVIQSVIRKTTVTQTHQTDTVTQLASEGRAEKFNKNTHTYYNNHANNHTHAV